jgi:hypothetical protein
MSHEINGRKAIEGVGNVGSECKSVRHKMGVAKTAKLRLMIGMVNTARLVKLNKEYSLQEGNKLNKFNA